MRPPKHGMLVHYVNRTTGRHHDATVEEIGAYYTANGTVNLVLDNGIRRFQVAYSEQPRPATWHYREGSREAAPPHGRGG